MSVAAVAKPILQARRLGRRSPAIAGASVSIRPRSHVEAMTSSSQGTRPMAMPAVNSAPKSTISCAVPTRVALSSPPFARDQLRHQERGPRQGHQRQQDPRLGGSRERATEGSGKPPPAAGRTRPPRHPGQNAPPGCPCQPRGRPRRSRTLLTTRIAVARQPTGTDAQMANAGTVPRLMKDGTADRHETEKNQHEDVTQTVVAERIGATGVSDARDDRGDADRHDRQTRDPGQIERRPRPTGRTRATYRVASDQGSPTRPARREWVPDARRCRRPFS